MAGGTVRALLVGLLVAADPADLADRAVPLPPSEDASDRIELATLLFPKEPIRLLKAQLRISGIDPEDVRRTLEALNRRSDLGQFTPDGFAPAPHLLERALSLPPDAILQFRWSGRAGKLVFQFTWR